MAKSRKEQKRRGREWKMPHPLKLQKLDYYLYLPKCYTMFFLLLLLLSKMSMLTIRLFQCWHNNKHNRLTSSIWTRRRRPINARWQYATYNWLYKLINKRKKETERERERMTYLIGSKVFYPSKPLNIHSFNRSYVHLSVCPSESLSVHLIVLYKRKSSNNYMSHDLRKQTTS